MLVVFFLFVCFSLVFFSLHGNHSYSLASGIWPGWLSGSWGNLHVAVLGSDARLLALRGLPDLFTVEHACSYPMSASQQLKQWLKSVCLCLGSSWKSPIL